MSAGWEPSEALKVFNDVNSDGEGGVGIEEFEAWWKGLLEREVRCFLCPTGGEMLPLSNLFCGFYDSCL